MPSRPASTLKTPPGAPCNGFVGSHTSPDVRSNFLPGAGKLTYLRTPQAREDIRIETGIEQGGATPGVAVT